MTYGKEMESKTFLKVKEIKAVKALAQKDVAFSFLWRSIPIHALLD